MRAFKRLGGLLKSERGNAFALGAAAMPLIMASAGFAIDTIHFSVMKRQMQRAADSSALAGAYALAQEEVPGTAVTRDLTRNSYPTLSETQQVVVGPSHGYQQTVRVLLTAKPRMPFMAIFTKTTSTVTGDATAAIVENGRFCVLSLYNGTDPGIDVGGNAGLDLGCGMAANARGDEAVRAFGSSEVNASPIMAVGGLNGSTSNYQDGVKLQPYSAEQTDPFADLANPPPQTCNNSETVDPNGNSTATLEPGCFKSLNIKGKVTLEPGTYYINGGDLEFGAQAEVTGTGVTFVMTGPGGAAGDLKMNGQASLNLKAPTTGEYAGILFYRDRRASNIEIKINGGSDAILEGALYFPSSDLTFTGNAGLQVRCLQMVGQKLKFRGTAVIENTCPGQGTLPTFGLQFVRLIQ